MRRIVSVFLAAASLAGCQSVLAQDQRVWQRMDGQRSTGNPAREQEFARVKNQCLVQVAQLPKPGGVNQTVIIGGQRPQGFDYAQLDAALAAGRASQLEDNIFTSCMNAGGYKFALPPG